MNHTIASIEKTFKESMANNQISTDSEIIADGHIHRFHITGDKPNTLNGWYVLYPDEIPSGAYGSWKTGASFAWCSKSIETLSQIERELYQQNLRKLASQRADEKALKHKETAQRALALWNSGEIPLSSHTYLLKKNVRPYSLKQTHGDLLVPLLDINGELQNLQIITPSGSKYFLRGGRVQGLFCPLGKIPTSGRLYICEGWATASTIHSLTQCSVIAALNAGNLKQVAVEIRQIINNKVQLIIAADNDRYTTGNPGLNKGKEAALATNARLIYPQFTCKNCNCSDFNDLHKCETEKEVI